MSDITLRNMIIDAQSLPTCLEWAYINDHKDCSGFHESLLRSCYIKNMMIHMLRNDYPRNVILGMLDLMEYGLDTSNVDADRREA